MIAPTIPRRRSSRTALPVALLAAAGFSASLATASAETPQGDLEYGAWLAGECVTCHQTSGRYDGIPPIVGWPEDSFVLIMKSYQDGARDHDVMRTIASRYDEEALWALAAYFASLKPSATD